MIAETKVDAKSLCKRYATSVDFCRVFNDDMNHLYTCAFLLVADHTKAEQCFVKSLEDCLTAGPVFRDWAETYAHRTIVKTALQIVSVSRSETLIDAQLQETLQDESFSNGHAIAVAITSLPIFQRFVYVLSVLERYSDRECASLLDSGIAEIVAARSEALENVAILLASVKPDSGESSLETARERRCKLDDVEPRLNLQAVATLCVGGRR